MIRKCLVVSSHIHLQNDTPESLDDNIKYIDLLLPVEDLWKLKKQIKKLDYLVASNEPSGDVKICKSQIYNFIQPHAVQETDRNWLLARVVRDEL